MTTSTTVDSLRAAAQQLSPTKFAHVVCATTRFEQMRDWYMQVINASIAFENEILCFLRYDDEHHRIGLLRRPVEEAAGALHTIDHYSFTYADLGELLGTYLRLKDAGIYPFWTINHGPTTSFYYNDPDANHIELQVDNLTNEEIDTFLAGGAYIRNPIGVIIDPEDWIERYVAGETAKSITLRPELPEGVSPSEMIRG